MKRRVAIVGRPNVGKSTLYNRLVGGRPALVHGTPGLTRDRRYGDVDYFGREFEAVDTGGLDPAAEASVIGAGIHRQAWRAIDEADLLMLVVDGAAGLAPADAEVARTIRAAGKPVVLAVNKIDSPKRDVHVADFFSLGLGEPYPVSAAHGRGVDELLDAVFAALDAATGADDEALAEADGEADIEADGERAGAAGDGGDDAERGDDGDDAERDDGGDDGGDHGDDDRGHDDGHDDDDDDDRDDDDDDAPPARHPRRPVDRKTRDRAARADAPVGPTRIAFIGKPNAGKSSLTNRLVGEERSLVHHEPGTTTDPVDSPLELRGRQYVLCDTAGIRRKARVEADVEKLAVTMALGQIERADVVILVIDAVLGPSEQDARLAGAVEEAGKALVIALNKSDLIAGDAAAAALRQATKDTFHFLTWAPVTMISAERGDGVARLMDLVDQVAVQHRRRVSTAELNRFFAEVCEAVPPPVWRGRSVRVYYLTQAAVRPPTYVLMVSQPQGVSPAYRRFLANQLRKRYGFRGTPVRVFTRGKGRRRKQR